MSAAFSTDRPIYLQLVDRLARQIARGELAPGERLQSVREMAGQYGINPNTVQRVHEELERMGLTETRRGQGAFVTDATSRIVALTCRLRQAATADFVATMTELGCSRDDMVAELERYWTGSEDRAKCATGEGPKQENHEGGTT